MTTPWNPQNSQNPNSQHPQEPPNPWAQFAGGQGAWQQAPVPNQPNSYPPTQAYGEQAGYGYQGGQPGYQGAFPPPPQPKKPALIVSLIVAAVVLIGGGVSAFVLLNKKSEVAATGGGTTTSSSTTGPTSSTLDTRSSTTTSRPTEGSTTASTTASTSSPTSSTSTSTSTSTSSTSTSTSTSAATETGGGDLSTAQALAQTWVSFINQDDLETAAALVCQAQQQEFIDSFNGQTPQEMQVVSVDPDNENMRLIVGHVADESVQTQLTMRPTKTGYFLICDGPLSDADLSW